MKLLLAVITVLYSSISYSETASAQCREIRNKLVVLEGQIQSSREKNCKECKSHLELQNEYNELMGELVIYEGLVSIGQAIEGNHKAVKNLERPQVVKARKQVDNFLTNYRKAALLDQSIASGFWRRSDGRLYDGKSALQLDTFMQAQCKRTEKGIQDFCKDFEKSKKEEGVNFFEIYQSLTNFSRAQGHTLSDRDKEHNFEKYRKSLELSIGGKKVDYKSPEGNQEMERIKQLRELLIVQRKNPSDKNSKAILDLSKKLETVEVNFGDRVEETNPEFQDFLNGGLKKGIAGFNHATRSVLQKDTAIENLDKLKKTISNRVKASKLTISQAIKEKAFCDGRNYEQLQRCFTNKCNPGHSGRCRQDAKNAKIVSNLHTITDQMKGLKSFSELEKKISEAKTCINIPTTDNSATDCINKLKKSLSLVAKDEVEQLKRDLHLKEQKLEELNTKEPFRSLKLAKAMGLMAYKNRCLDPEDDKSVSDFKSLCGDGTIDDFAQAAISLSKDAQDILDYSNNPFINKDIKMPGGEQGIRVAEFLDNCKKTPTDSLCSLYQKDEALNGKLQERIKKVGRTITATNTKNRKVPTRVNLTKKTDPNLTAQFVGGMANTLLTQGLPFYFQLDTTKSNHEMQMNYYRNRLSYMQNQYEYYSTNPTTYYYSSYPQMNYGYSLYNYDQASTFGGTSNYAMFNQPDNFGQFSFDFQVMNPYSDTTFTTPTTTPSTQTNGFSF
ncbi:MAG: hypothetical protein KC478_00630 [Bacteriovoracaceae bacterium]|nr:hypothetical protein [Bacteriovoracaceae bacterium]